MGVNRIEFILTSPELKLDKNSVMRFDQFKLDQIKVLSARARGHTRTHTHTNTHTHTHPHMLAPRLAHTTSRRSGVKLKKIESTKNTSLDHSDAD